MKTKLSISKIRNNFKCFKCGANDLHYIFYGIDAPFYNSGYCGWNCDIWLFYNIAIQSGYRNMAGVKIPSEILEKYTQNAKSIMDSTRKWNEQEKLLFDNAVKFVEELQSI